MKYCLIQIESNLLNADPNIMSAFAELVQDQQTKEELIGMILSDFQICLRTIEEVLEAPVETRRVSRLVDNKLRNSALSKLHEMQIHSLKKWRSIRNTDPQQNDQYLLQLLLLINALSGGLKSTG